MASKVSKGQRYIGETKQQLRDGYGIYKYSNHFFRYEGDWKEGKKHGHGKLVMADGSYYEGEFIHGEIEGHGFRKWSSGVTYSGQFSDGEMNGHGVMTYADGAVYEGEFLSNKREGRGVLKQSDGAVYEGSFHNDKKHGEGSQNYLNGDVYLGDWIQGLRQGSGELRCADTTIYDGQWRSDLYNGQGTMIHSSGMTYEGLWVNGRPAVEAAEIVLLGDPEMEMYQGTSFGMEVEIRSEGGELVEQESGRVLQITAGFHHYTPSQASPLFDLIEDMEEKTMPTPYGYDVVAYPLTEYSYIEEKYCLDGYVPKPTTALTEVTSVEASILEEPVHVPQIEVIQPVSESVEESAKPDPSKTQEGAVTEVVSTEPSAQPSSQPSGSQPPAQPSAQPSGTQPPAQPATEPAESTPATAADVTVATEQAPPATAEETSPVPPPINNQKAEGGRTSFKDLILPGASPSYLPYSSSPGKEDSDLSLSADQSSRSGAKAKVKSSGKGTKRGEDDLPTHADASMLEKRDPKAYKVKREKLYGDERFARPAEYVIMVSDVTEPSFMGKRLPTAYCLIKIQHPKKSKKVKTPSKGSKPSSRGSSHD